MHGLAPPREPEPQSWAIQRRCAPATPLPASAGCALSSAIPAANGRPVRKSSALCRPLPLSTVPAKSPPVGLRFHCSDRPSPDRPPAAFPRISPALPDSLCRSAVAAPFRPANNWPAPCAQATSSADNAAIRLHPVAGLLLGRPGKPLTSAARLLHSPSLPLPSPPHGWPARTRFLPTRCAPRAV